MNERLTGIFDQARSLQVESTQPGRKALASMLAVAGDVVASRGYKGTRVDDVVAGAGISHGAFYRYFDNVDELVRLIAVRAVDETSGPLRALPDPGDRESLRRWLCQYREAHAAQGPLIRVWVEAVETELRDERAAVFDWGRRRLARLLAGRDGGDVEIDAMILLATVEAFGSAPADSADVDAAIRVVERGFLGDADGP
jgi:AcrR family transcriptional regulator